MHMQRSDCFYFERSKNYLFGYRYDVQTEYYATIVAQFFEDYTMLFAADPVLFYLKLFIFLIVFHSFSQSRICRQWETTLSTFELYKVQTRRGYLLPEGV